MPTLAHESNPKEDSITIALGDVLSTATLDVEFLFPVTAPNIPAADVPIQVLSATCADVFTWPGDDFIHLVDRPGLSGGSQTKLWDQTIDLEINSTPLCYGILWQRVDPLHFQLGIIHAGCAGILWDSRFNGVISGTPHSGPAIWIDDDSTHKVAYAYGLIVDMQDNVSKLCRWVGTSLADYSEVLATMRVPTTGEYLRLFMDQYPDNVGFNGVFAEIYTSAGALSTSVSYVFEDSKPFNNIKARHSKCGVGFISVGGTSAGRSHWTHSASPIFAPQLQVMSNGGI